MKKILQINTVAVHGSTGRISEGISEEAVKRGYESYVAYGRNHANSNFTNLIK